MYHVKSLKTSDKVATVKLHAQTAAEQKQVKALYALAGGYNEVARHVELDRYIELEKQFDRVVAEMTELL